MSDAPNFGHEGDWAQPDLKPKPNTPVPDELASVRAQIRILEEREGALRSILLSDPTARTGANWLAEVKTVQQSRVDLKELRACHPDIVEQFEFPTEITRIVLMGIDQDTGEIVSARKMRATGADQ
jgi:hypothetical protein